MENEFQTRIIDFAKAYSREREEIREKGKSKLKYRLKDTLSFDLISKHSLEFIYEKINLSKKEYLISGSIGNGNSAEIPWIGIFDITITKSAQNGFYIVYLFNKKLDELYLTLNQGWTQYENTYLNNKIAQANIIRNTKHAQQVINIPSNIEIDQISLGSKSRLAVGYELGNICYIKYNISSLPDDKVLFSDIEKMINLYQQLKSVVGSNILDINSTGSEDRFQTLINNKVKSSKRPTGPVEKKAKSQKNNKYSFDRDVGIAKSAISNAGYICENNPTHETFISAYSNENFVEAHHLIPIEFQDNFKYSIDIIENIICLCPNCHRLFHNAEKKMRSEIIKRFYYKRKEALIRMGIDICIEDLLKYYKN